MKTIQLPHTEVTAPSIVSGQMRISDKTDQEIRELYECARANGINFFDHADIYGSKWHDCESRFAQALGLTPSQREEIILQTKCGIVKDKGYYDSSYEHIMKQVDGSLGALRTDYIDFLLLHRPDALIEPEEVARAFDELHTAGKVRYFGVSNYTPRQIQALQAALSQPLVVNQLQLSVVHSPIIAQGVASNMLAEKQAIVRDGGGVVDYCRANNMTIQAWSPFQSGFFTGPFLGNPGYPGLNALASELAEKYQVHPEAIAAAWITRHPANMQVVVGTTHPRRLASIAGGEANLTREEWYALFTAAGHIVP